ncbi:hypothetical protein [Macrococcus armenti]|uniref:hypothetical protein n=1 Tax=Macrococcus armenti TaxID=2875764 RepID=UPI001CCA0A79|nr:hypothetical protein [Macrococcus armenti]UBH16399.1 hypothetical protein LAU44_05435 [Macrococcus armenti]UBH18755.1 hypothetical protein LAU39_05445 [Macrococcus armenti]UBH21027.1 hypothetical protein LAU40_05440 [Macrococcus armenti]
MLSKVIAKFNDSVTGKEMDEVKTNIHYTDDEKRFELLSTVENDHKKPFIKALTKLELTNLADANGIEYPSKVKRDELEALIEAETIEGGIYVGK